MSLPAGSGLDQHGSEERERKAEEMHQEKELKKQLDGIALQEVDRQQLGEHMQKVNRQLEQIQESQEVNRQQLDEHMQKVNRQLEQIHESVNKQQLDEHMQKVNRQQLDEHMQKVNRQLEQIHESQEVNRQQLDEHMQKMNRQLEQIQESQEVNRQQLEHMQKVNRQQLDEYMQKVNRRLEQIQELQEVKRQQLDEHMQKANRQLEQIHKSQEVNRQQLDEQIQKVNRQLEQIQESVNRQQLDEHMQKVNRQLKQIQESVNRLDGKIRELQKAIECFLQLQKRNPLLSWTQTSKAPPMIMIRGSATVCGNMAYFRPGFSRCVLSCNSSSEKMSTLPACPKEYFTLTVVNGLVTAVGGWLFPAWLGPRKSTNTLLSLMEEDGMKKWVEHFPRMPTKRDLAAVVCNGKVLVVAGGVQENGRKLTTVEVMDIETLKWSRASSLPQAVYAASATVCGDCIYLVGGCGQHGWTTSVLTCSLSALLQSESNSQVWDTIADLPVTCSTCATLNEQVVAVGGRYSDKKVTNNIYSYNRETNSWEVISQMPTPRCWCLVTVLPGNKLMVMGGRTGTRETDIVETAQF